MDTPENSPHSLSQIPLTYRFRYFKGFADAELCLREPVTLLIGRNGAGKSNALEGIDLLSKLGAGLPLSLVNDSGQGDLCEVRGGLDGCVMAGEQWFMLGMDQPESRYELVLRADPAEVESERLEVKNGLGFVTERQRGPSETARRLVFHVNKEQREPEPQGYADIDRAFLITHFFLLSQANRSSIDSLDRLTVPSFSVHLIDPHPRSMRRYARAGAVGRRPLSRDGHNLSAVLYGLHKRGHIQNDTKNSPAGETARTTLAHIMGIVQQVPEERFERLDFIVAEQTQDVMLALRRSSGALIDARVLSDGTLRVLAILAAIETLPEGSLILLEDYDEGLHASRVKLLTDTIWHRCKERNLRVLATTHNPAALNALDAEKLRGVVLCYYDHKIGASQLKPLLGLPDADLLLSEGPLGEVVTKGRIEPHLDPNFAEKRRQAALKWLESL